MEAEVGADLDVSAAMSEKGDLEQGEEEATKASTVRASLFVKMGSCRGSVRKWRRPRPINRHAAPKAAVYWGPRCFALAPSLLY